MVKGGAFDTFALACDPLTQTIEEDVDDGCGEKSENLAEKQASHHRDAERTANFRSNAVTKGERNAAEQISHCGHHDGTEAQEACLLNSFCRVQSVFALGLECEVDDHNAVLLHTTDEQDDANDGDAAEVLLKDHERE